MTRRDSKARTSRRCRRGFTLLEVLAALLLVAIVLPVAMGALSAATQAGSLARQRDRATTLAEAKLAELVIERNWASSAREGGFDASWGADADRFTWRLATANWSSQAMLELTVEVTWPQRGEEQSVRLTTVVPAVEAAP